MVQRARAGTMTHHELFADALMLIFLLSSSEVNAYRGRDIGARFSEDPSSLRQYF